MNIQTVGGKNQQIKIMKKASTEREKMFAAHITN